VLRLRRSGGLARARNLGAQAAQGDLLLFLDAEVALHPDALEKVVEAFQKDDKLAAIFGSYDDAPAAQNFLSQYRNLLHHFVHQQSQEDASTFFAGCGAIRKDLFLAIGGFDERYQKPSIEDVELGYRLTRAGYRIRLCKTVLATYLKEWRVGYMLRRDLLQRAVPWTELILEEGQFRNDLNLRHENRASVVLIYAALGWLLFSTFMPRLLLFAVWCFLAMLVLNRQLFAFFYRQRGLGFALCTVPWVCLFYLYSGLGFLIGLWKHLNR
jgi:glycosyltransferase involved in cell wall biosynthesis